jgi:predicted ATPase
MNITLARGCSFTNALVQIFDIVTLLNNGSSLVVEMSEKVEIARLNVSAGLKAKSSAAFGPALNYLQHASTLIGKDFWDADYAFTFCILLYSYHVLPFVDHT